jgi:hypothetical protein
VPPINFVVFSHPKTKISPIIIGFFSNVPKNVKKAIYAKTVRYDAPNTERISIMSICPFIAEKYASSKATDTIQTDITKLARYLPINIEAFEIGFVVR